MTQEIPVTIITGFLGAGKTTLIGRMLSDAHGLRMAVIENEFAEEGIDDAILHVGSEQRPVIAMNNGCICCTVRGDLIRILGYLQRRRAKGEFEFDRVIIETTGLADPAAVAQTFFVDEGVALHYRLDAIVTLVDAVHAEEQLDQHQEAQDQVGFADRILLSKCDLVDRSRRANLERRLRRMNRRAGILESDFGRVPIDQVIDVRGFDLDATLSFDPTFLDDTDHDHDQDVRSFVFRTDLPLDPARLEDYMTELVAGHGKALMRYKGVLHVAGIEERVILQGVHDLIANDLGSRWEPAARRESRLVFIGRGLPKDEIIAGLESCTA
jgi:G3E family GTPase